MAAKRVQQSSQGERRQQQQQRAQRKPTVSIIGAGRLGSALASALAQCGYPIEAVVARHAASARRAAKISGAHPLALNTQQLGQLPASRLLFITTPDDAIAATASKLASILRERPQQHSRIALHASGALSAEALSDLRESGCAVGSLHPLISVSDPVHGAASLREAFYCVEGESAAVRAARRIVRDLGGESFTVGTPDKALYHAAAVMASGHLTALFDLAAEMLVRCGLNEKRARAVLLPLVRSTVENLENLAPARALTGTFARADLATMHRHLAALRAQAGDEALAVYLLLGQRSLRLAQQNGANDAALKEMARVLRR